MNNMSAAQTPLFNGAQLQPNNPNDETFNYIHSDFNMEITGNTLGIDPHFVAPPSVPVEQPGMPSAPNSPSAQPLQAPEVNAAPPSQHGEPSPRLGMVRSREEDSNQLELQALQEGGQVSNCSACPINSHCFLDADQYNQSPHKRA